MSDIFISYTREDHAQAQALAAARCVVVIWPKFFSASFDWMKTEAAERLPCYK
ncbi:MAG: hypothetical protein ABI674_03960 [Spartobacteria bacterium]